MSYLPKLLHRSFIIGFLLPSILFCAYIDFALRPAAMLDQIFEQPRLLKYSLSSVVLSIFLSALNRPIIRLLEGYGTFNPFKVLLPRVRRYFRARVEPLYAEARRVEDARKSDPSAKPQIADFAKKLAVAVRSYPDREDLLLPTKFGNVYRAFEVYSRTLYELDAIPAWPRLEMLLPARVQDQLRDARASLDFTINILVLSLTTLAIILERYVWDQIQSPVQSCIIPMISATYAWLMLPATAQQWGEAVRSVFDLYRDRLARSLGLRLPSNTEDERKMWREVSRFMIFRTASPLTLLKPFRKKIKDSKAVTSQVASLDVSSKRREAGP